MKIVVLANTCRILMLCLFVIDLHLAEERQPPRLELIKKFCSFRHDIFLSISQALFCISFTKLLTGFLLFSQFDWNGHAVAVT